MFVFYRYTYFDLVILSNDKLTNAFLILFFSSKLSENVYLNVSSTA